MSCPGLDTRHSQSYAWERMSRDDRCQQIARDPDFAALIRQKAALIVPATLFFVFYYFALPVAAGWFPQFMQKEIWGRVNVAYLFALSQFFMTWGLAFLYVWAAAGWDRQEHRLLKKFGADSKE